MVTQKERVQLVNDSERMIALRTYIYNTPVVGDQPGLILARCLAGEYKMLELLLEDGSCVGVAVYKYEPPTHTLHLAVLSAPNEVETFRPLLLSWFGRLGATKLIAVTKHNHDAIVRAVVKNLETSSYTVLEVRLR